MAYSNQLNRVIKLIGPQSAIRMSRLYGGRFYRVPIAENLHDMHPLVVAIGLEHASILAKVFANEQLKFPIEVNTLMQVRNDLIIKRVSEGESLSSIANDLQIDRKMIQKVVALYVAMGKAGEIPDQESLL